MRRFRRGRTRGRSSPTRNREWFSFTTGLSFTQPRLQAMVAGQTFKAWALDPLTAAEVYDEPTIVRMLLNPQIFVGTQPSVTTNDYRLTMRGGFITWKSSTLNNAITTDLDGVDANDPSLDWLWWNETFFGHYNLNTYGSSFHDFSGGASGIVDVKSKRKLELGYGLAGVWNVLSDSIPATTGVINWHMSGRVLVLNH